MSTSTARLPRVPESFAPLPSVPETRAALPSVPESVAPLPKTPESVAPLPRVRETILPPGTIPYIPPRIDTVSSSEETSVADVLPIHSVGVESSTQEGSSTDLVPIQYLDAVSSSEATSDADVSDARPLEAVSESEESSSVEIAAVLVTESSSEESSSVTPGFDTVSSTEESSSLDVELIGVLHPVSSSEETSSVDIRTFSPSRMIRNAASANFGTTPSKVTGWVADPAVPGSTVVDNELIVQGNTTGATVAADIDLDYTGFGSSSATVDLILEGVGQIATSGSVSVPSAGTVVHVEATGLTLDDGQHVWVEARRNGASNVLAINSVVSYVRIFTP